MKYFYPNAVAVMNIVWEDFGAVGSVPALSEINAIPLTTKVEVNSYCEADTFEVELDYKTFPFDPRTIKSCQLTIHMENLTDGALNDPNAALTPTDENVMFIGFADEGSITMDESRRTVRLKGRDFTALLLDAKWPGTALSLGAPVDVVIRGILGRLPGLAGVTVVNKSSYKTLPILASFYTDPASLAGQRSAKPNERYWDVIQDICTHAGLICYVDLDEFVITEPRTLYDASKAVQFVYGKNIKSLEMSRRFGRQKGFNLVVRSIYKNGVLEAYLPRESKRLEGAGKDVFVPIQTPLGVQVNEQDLSTRAPLISFVIKNCNNKAHLIACGEKIYEEIGRQQIEGKITTCEMDAPAQQVDPLDAAENEPACFDLLNLRAATPIQIIIGSDDLQFISALASNAARVQYLLKRGYSLQVATLFAQTLGKFKTPFYTKAVSFMLDENGFKVEIDFINFIETGDAGLGIA